jgi:hypothetical protein
MPGISLEDKFAIRTYGFAELAQLYFPAISKNSASSQLSRWINAAPSLKEALESKGKKRRQRLLSPVQVKMIVDEFGEP